MFKGSVLKQATRAGVSVRACSVTSTSSRPIAAALSQRCIHSTRTLSKEGSGKRIPQEQGDHIGTHSRTDNRIEIPFDEEFQPEQKPVQGRGGFHFKRTLSSFSLEGNVGLVTGGARGLGLVMSQSLVVSGADVAIVDLNSES